MAKQTAKPNYKRGVTPIGEALFAHLKATEVILDKDTGKYTLMLKLKEADKAALLKDIEAEWKAFKASDEMKGKKTASDWSNGIKEYKDEGYFKFSANAEIKTKRGDTFENKVPVFDSMQQNISDKIKELGNGSLVRVAYELVPFYMSNKIHGISLRLRAVQLHKYVEAGGSAESFGFEQDDSGFALPEDESAPFMDSSEDGGDF